ncbi:hypothetical protein DFJ74DRAFT_774515 [Hyaloraphidium curvatum]|nr:hypothetical protein DFJ74DRAFT_774515 [Hyaloraphidium curvatum]
MTEVFASLPVLLQVRIAAPLEFQCRGVPYSGDKLLVMEVPSSVLQAPVDPSPFGTGLGSYGVEWRKKVWASRDWPCLGCGKPSRFNLEEAWYFVPPGWKGPEQGTLCGHCSHPHVGVTTEIVPYCSKTSTCADVAKEFLKSVKEKRKDEKLEPQPMEVPSCHSPVVAELHMRVMEPSGSFVEFRPTVEVTRELLAIPWRDELKHVYWSLGECWFDKTLDG